MSKSQIETDQNILDFLGDLVIETPDDLVVLKNKIIDSLEFRPYNNETKDNADRAQWKRTASEILADGYVYQGKACSDIAIVFLALCRAAGVDGYLVKLKSIDGKKTHSIVEVKLKDDWYRIEPVSKSSLPFRGQLTPEAVWNKEYKVWKRGRDLWDLGLDNIKSELNILQEE